MIGIRYYRLPKKRIILHRVLFQSLVGSLFGRLKEGVSTLNMSLYPIEHIDTIQHSHITHLRNCALVLLGYTVIGNTRQG